MNMKKYLAAAAAAVLTCVGAGAHAQAGYPQKPVHIIVPFAAGGSTDILARMTANALAADLGVSVVVENKAGASGNIGMEAVAKAAPDGHTLLFTSTNLTMNPAVIDKVPYDPIRDFSGVTMLAFGPMLLITQPNFGGGTLRGVIDQVRANPGKFNFSSSGAGGAPHLAGEMLKLREGLDMVHVPYPGAAPALTDIVSGQVQMTFTTYVSARSLLDAGRVGVVAVASAERLPVLPNVPTFAEEGLKDFEIGTMFGLLAPKGTPGPIIERLYQAVKKAAEDPEFRKKITDLGASVVINTPADYDVYLQHDVAKWAEFVKNIK